MRLTKRACEGLAALPKEEIKGRPTEWDDEIPGFGARINGPGRVSFILKYRVKDDPKQRVATLGDFPSTTADLARDEASQIRSAARLGRDLLAERKEERAKAATRRQEDARRGVSLATLLDGWRQTVADEKAAKVALRGRATYEQELLRLEAKVIRPAFGTETVGSFDPRRFQALIRSQPSVNGARNLRNTVTRFTAWANDHLMLQGIPVEWPTRFEVKGRPKSRTHRFDLQEAARIWIAAGALGRRGALVRWMLLTGCRRIEAQTMTWDHLTMEHPINGPYWDQPAALVKNDQPHRVPLSPPAIALLRWLPRRETKDAPASPLVFAGRGGKPVGGWTDIRQAVMTAAGVDEGTLHDFRRTLVSTLGDHGFDPQVADKLLNHAAASSMGGVMGVYQRSELWAKRREAIDLWTDLLMGAVAKALDKPPGPAAWGFEQPFLEARIVRPGRAANQKAK